MMAHVLAVGGVLGAVWVVLLFGGFAFGRPASPGGRRMPTWTRLGSSLALVAFGWIGSVIVGTASAVWLALGMTLGFVGDVVLADVLSVPQPLIGGMAAFGLGHIAYIVALVLMGMGSVPVWGALGLWWLIGIIGWFVMVQRGSPAHALTIAALPYALLLTTTAGLATGLAVHAPRFIPVALGAALFVISDGILAAERFRGWRFPLSADLIWLTYGPAQALILTALLAISTH